MLTAHQLIAIRRRATPARVEEVGPREYRLTLGQAWARLQQTRIGWTDVGPVTEWILVGPYQIIRDQETLADTRKLRAILRELGVRGIPEP